MTILVDPKRLLEIARSIPHIEGVSEGHEAPACQAKRYGARCVNVAVWSMRSKCCGQQALACQGCFNILTDSAPTDSLFCRRCGHEAWSMEGIFLCTRL